MDGCGLCVQDTENIRINAFNHSENKDGTTTKEWHKLKKNQRRPQEYDGNSIEWEK